MAVCLTIRIASPPFKGTNPFSRSYGISQQAGCRSDVIRLKRIPAACLAVLCTQKYVAYLMQRGPCREANSYSARK